MFNYGLFLSLFLLAPGFACWCSFRLSNNLNDVTLTPEKDGSTITIGIILISSLLAHFVMETLFAINQLWCSFGFPCISISGDPDVYHGLITMGKRNGTGYPSSAILWIWLAQILSASLITFFVTKALLRMASIRKIVLRHTYGWLYPMIEQLLIDPRTALIARVITKTELDGRLLVFDGEVVNFTFGDKKQVCNISLAEVMAYSLGKQGKSISMSIKDLDVIYGVQSGPLYQDRPHDRLRLNISEDNISNITFEIFRKPD